MTSKIEQVTACSVVGEHLAAELDGRALLEKLRLAFAAGRMTGQENEQNWANCSSQCRSGPDRPTADQ
jgi:hypothetical protein